MTGDVPAVSFYTKFGEHVGCAFTEDGSRCLIFDYFESGHELLGVAG